MPGTPPTGPPASPFCTGDQIGESVSDWLASEVLPEYIAKHHPKLTRDQYRTGYSNAFRGDCNNANPMPPFHPPGDPHPPNSERVNKIILANPQVRRQMGCAPADPEKARHCTVERKEAK
jgi:hypothetical protein